MTDLQSINSPTECNLLIAFVDIAAFGKTSEGVPPARVVAMLSSFYELVGDVIESAGGTVVKFIGDSAFVVFPEEDARAGVSALRELKRQAEEHFATFGFKSELTIQAHVGRVTCAKVGTRTDKRLDLFGDAVNFTAR